MANSSKPKLTPNQKAYAHQIKLLKKRIANAEKSGFRFFENVVPQTPDRIYKRDIERVKELRGNRLYASATALNEETGEIVSGIEGAKLKRKEAGKKGTETRKRKQNKQQQKEPKQEQYYPNGGDIVFSNVLEQFISRLSEPPQDFYQTRWGRKARKQEEIIEASERAKSTLLSLTYSAVEREGKSAVGWRLEAQADEVQQLTTYILYGSNSSAIASACSRLATIINGGALSMQQLQDIAEQEEYNEDAELPQ